MISIIIPTMNESKVLEKTLSNLKNLSHDHEIIISDGKSTDNTREIAQKYNCKIIEYKDTPRQTISLARNMGASLANGEYIVFLDADVLIPDVNMFFTKVISKFETNKNLTGYAPFINYMVDEATLADKFFGFVQNMIYLISNNVLHIGQSAGEFQMVRAKDFKKLGGYNEKLVAGEDVEFFSRMASLGQTIIDKDLCVYQSTRRVHKVGWPKLLSTWFLNWLSVSVFKKSFSNVWHEVR